MRSIVPPESPGLRCVGGRPGFANLVAFRHWHTFFDTIPIFRTVKAKGPARGWPNGAISLRTRIPGQQTPGPARRCVLNTERGMTDLYAAPCHRSAVQ